MELLTWTNYSILDSDGICGKMASGDEYLPPSS
ncbi:hypothetical protein A2U01_0101876, partial [Trifolium medium]|nr:hypothetical protein [Trifolium medium]